MEKIDILFAAITLIGVTTGYLLHCAHNAHECIKGLAEIHEFNLMLHTAHKDNIDAIKKHIGLEDKNKDNDTSSTGSQERPKE